MADRIKKEDIGNKSKREVDPNKLEIYRRNMEQTEERRALNAQIDYIKQHQRNMDEPAEREYILFLKDRAYRALQGDVFGNEKDVKAYIEALHNRFREIDVFDGEEEERNIIEEIVALQKHEKFQKWKELSKLQEEQLEPDKTQAYDELNSDISENEKAITDYVRVLKQLRDIDGPSGAASRKVSAREWLVLQCNEKFRRWNFSKFQEQLEPDKTQAYEVLYGNKRESMEIVMKYEKKLANIIIKAIKDKDLVYEEFCKGELVALQEARDYSGSTDIPEAIKFGQKSATTESSGSLDHLSRLSQEEQIAYKECIEIADTIETFTIVNPVIDTYSYLSGSFTLAGTFTLQNNETAKFYTDKKRIMDNLKHELIKAKEAKEAKGKGAKEEGSKSVLEIIADAKKILEMYETNSINTSRK